MREEIEGGKLREVLLYLLDDLMSIFNNFLLGEPATAFPFYLALR